MLTIDGVATSYFAALIEDNDRAVLGLCAEPSSSDQQVLEALAILVSLREFVEYWRSERIILTIRTDNIAALAMCAKMQPHSQQLGIVARELALDVADSSYSPDIVEHIPGLSNVAADALSRLAQPGKEAQIPEYLHATPRHICKPRGTRWWRSIALPASP